ncbi:unnamed protein product [Darwinula stevensoni]|uniref:Tetraspanin n=1 Tax=Darwinula stevensoni TaxID=69355 RepID=A0A7R9A309_9CRUS|nr:unnamed protein product [Darwinula stevensoni]CAG0880349.1 unnamed protein product [Darwinula stevensoni]
MVRRSRSDTAPALYPVPRLIQDGQGRLYYYYPHEDDSDEFQSVSGSSEGRASSGSDSDNRDRVVFPGTSRTKTYRRPPTPLPSLEVTPRMDPRIGVPSLLPLDREALRSPDFFSEMALNPVSSIYKYILWIVNFLFFVSGVVILALGIWAKSDQSSFMKMLALSNLPGLDNWFSPSILDKGSYGLIAIGAFITIISFLGCCGACLESRVLLLIAEHQLQLFLLNTLHKYPTPTTKNDVTVAWDRLMVDLNCCGVFNYTDFRRENPTTWTTGQAGSTQTSNALPLGCCVMKDKGKMIPESTSCPDNPGTGSFYQDGCLMKMREWLDRNSIIIGGVGAAIAIFQIFGIIVSCCLCHNFSSVKPL